MGLFVIRLFGLGGALACAAIVYYNWQELLREGTYSLRAATIAPIFVLGGLYIMLFPTKIGRPETTLDKFVTFLIVVVGLAAGLYNWYLMDPGFFKF